MNSNSSGGCDSTYKTNHRVRGVGLDQLWALVEPGSCILIAGYYPMMLLDLTQLNKLFCLGISSGQKEPKESHGSSERTASKYVYSRYALRHQYHLSPSLSAV